MINETNLSKYLLDDAISIACYVMNHVLLRIILKMAQYEWYKGRKPNISHLYVFRYKWIVLNEGKVNLIKFDVKKDEGLKYLIIKEHYI